MWHQLKLQLNISVTKHETQKMASMRNKLFINLKKSYGVERPRKSFNFWQKIYTNGTSDHKT